ncbi:MAG: RDD family protein [Verrucomicrobiaceae bacterium]|nr:RDD family protein [Verrucomicrobiaceae bacterium]
MPNWFYTDALATKQGPVDDATLLELNRTGGVTAKSLVWHEEMEDPTPFRAVAGKLIEADNGGDPVEIGVCAHSGRVCRVEEMLPYGEALIAPEHKETFLQIMMEGATVEITDATHRGAEYVGFWWRSLSSLLDYMIKMVPAMLCMAPYYIVTFTSGITAGAGAGAGDDFQSLTGFTAAMMLAYGFGLLGVLAVSIVYDTWMVGKYQATAGKMIIGAKVVNPDGLRLTYKRAFLRWLAKKPLNYLIVWIPSGVGFGLVVAVIAAASNNSENNATGFIFAMITGLFLYFALLALCSGVYWMAAFDPEKRALHDRIASTRVVKK